MQNLRRYTSVARTMYIVCMLYVFFIILMTKKLLETSEKFKMKISLHWESNSDPRFPDTAVFQLLYIHCRYYMRHKYQNKLYLATRKTSEIY